MASALKVRAVVSPWVHRFIALVPTMVQGEFYQQRDKLDGDAVAKDIAQVCKLGIRIVEDTDA